jgi:DNA-binding SARP family transcriptional activator
MAVQLASLPRLDRGAATAGTRLSLLQGFELRQAGEVIELPPSAQRLLAFLALQARPLQRLYVAGSIWLDSSQEHANANLRTALWRLRLPGCPLVRTTSHQLALADSVLVDMHDVAARAQRALHHRAHESDLAALCTAGDVLPDWYDDWLLIERERFRQLRLHALEALCDELADAGAYAAATEAGLAAVAGEPLRETAHRALIRAHLAEGNVGEALRQYQLYEGVLRGDLGLEPSDSVRHLFDGLSSPRVAAAVRRNGS